MWTVVVATALSESVMQVMVEPLRGSITTLISKVDTKGRVPSSDVLESMNTVLNVMELLHELAGLK